MNTGIREVNSPENVQLPGVIGNLGDFVIVPYSFAQNTIMAHLNTAYYHVHGANFIYPDKAVPVLLTSDAAAWGIAATPTTIIPANTITKNFDLHWASVSEISATLYGIIDVYGDDGEGWFKIGPLCDVVRTTNFSRENPQPVQVPQQPANRAIGVIFSDNTTSARTVRLKLYGHVYDISL